MMGLTGQLDRDKERNLTLVERKHWQSEKSGQTRLRPRQDCVQSAGLRGVACSRRNWVLPS